MPACLHKGKADVLERVRPAVEDLQIADRDPRGRQPGFFGQIELGRRELASSASPSTERAKELGLGSSSLWCLIGFMSRDSRAEAGLIEAFRNVVVQIGVLDQGAGNCRVTKRLRFLNAAVPLVGREVPLSNAHQHIEL